MNFSIQLGVLIAGIVAFCWVILPRAIRFIQKVPYADVNVITLLFLSFLNTFSGNCFRPYD